MTISQQIKDLKQRVEHSIKQFSTGNPVLVGDDGKRENEVDLVFHASFASKEIVNLSITHAKGLLCVALDHELADKLGFYTAPRFPGGISHTNFTLTVDAKHDITSGISATDRAHTIKLMAKPNSCADDFITPGHVFPLRSVKGGLLARAGHTEALYELCNLSHLVCAGAMCEILDINGDPITPSEIGQNEIFSKFCFISTVDLLWHKVLLSKNSMHSSEKQNEFSTFEKSPFHENKYILKGNQEENIVLASSIQFHTHKIQPQNIRIVHNNGDTQCDNNIQKINCCAEIILMSIENLNEELPNDLIDFCDLSQKVGLKNTQNSVKRLVTLLRSLNFICQKNGLILNEEFIDNINFPVQSDKEFLKACFQP